LADRDLASAEVAGLSADWRLAIAYNAALQSAAAALAACGYRAQRESYHYRVVHSLELTISENAAVVQHLDAFRKKRNVGSYDRAGMASDQDAEDMLELAKAIRRKVEVWLRKNKPDLIE
jgi:hypothetical protein